MSSFCRFTVALLICLAHSSSCSAQINSEWIGGSGSWTDSSKWTSSNFPNNTGGMTYWATVASGTVTLDQDITIDSFFLGTFGRIKSDTPNSLSILDEMRISGEGDVGGFGSLGLDIVVEQDGTLELDFSQGAVVGVLQNATLSNRGQGSYLGGSWVVNSDGVFNNSGVLDLKADGRMFIRGSNNSGLFENSGNVNKTAGTGTTEIDVTFNNSGIVQVETGQLSLTASGLSSGEFRVAENAILNFQGRGNHVVQNGSLLGDGTIRVDGGLGGVLAIDASTHYDVAKTILDQGSMRIDGDAKTGVLDLIKSGSGGSSIVFGSGVLTVSDHFNFSREGGITGSVVVSQGATLTIDNPTNALFGNGITSGGILTNNGTGTFAGGRLDIGSNSLFENNRSFDLGPDGANFFGSGQIVNNGDLTKQNGTGTATMTQNFTNTGDVSITGSVIEFSGEFTQTGGQFVLDNARVESARDMNVVGGSLEGFGRFNAKINLDGGMISAGFGTDDVSELAIGGDLTLGENAIFFAEMGGANQGSQGTTSDYIGVDGDVFLDGLLEIELIGNFGASLEDGDWIQLLGSISPDEMMVLGEFDNVASGEFLIEDGYRFQVFYGAGSKYRDTSVVLEFSSVPEPSATLLLFMTCLATFSVRRKKSL